MLSMSHAYCLSAQVRTSTVINAEQRTANKEAKTQEEMALDFYKTKQAIEIAQRVIFPIRGRTAQRQSCEQRSVLLKWAA